MSLPQKDSNGMRTGEDNWMFIRALEVMGLCYASIGGTVAVQCKLVPPRPALYDGRVILFNVGDVAIDALRAELARFGEVAELEVQARAPEALARPPVSWRSLLPTLRWKLLLPRVGELRQVGSPVAKQAYVRFATHAQAEDCVATLRRENRALDFAYNATPYEARGWPTFEEGLAKLVVAHLGRLTARGHELPRRLQQAVLHPKLVTIDAYESHVCETSGDPKRLLRETTRAIGDSSRTRFTGKGDRDTVQRMLAEVEWVMKMALDEQMETMSEHEAVTLLLTESLNICADKHSFARQRC